MFTMNLDLSSKFELILSATMRFVLGLPLDLLLLFLQYFLVLTTITIIMKKTRKRMPAITPT